MFLGGKRNKGRRGEGGGAAGGEKEKIKKREREGKRDEGRAFTQPSPYAGLPVWAKPTCVWIAPRHYTHARLCAYSVMP